jgi:hypothetical protein
MSTSSSQGALSVCGVDESLLVDFTARGIKPQRHQDDSDSGAFLVIFKLNKGYRVVNRGRRLLLEVIRRVANASVTDLLSLRVNTTTLHCGSSVSQHNLLQSHKSKDSFFFKYLASQKTQ